MECGTCIPFKMFVLCRVADVIQVAPELFSSDYSSVLIEEIDRKYANKVIADVGLCITHYDFIEIGDAYIHPSDGTSHTDGTLHDQDPYYMYLNEEIRFRVTNINFTRVLKTAKGPQLISISSRFILPLGMQAVTDATDSKPDKHEAPSRRRSSSVDLSDSDPKPAALQIIVTIDEDGLGLSSWGVEI
ncbi:hypothetical protein DYB28_014544 [Aphanomyces astaci]|uniref:RNA polymerase Rpb7-like N-terminal domain-containing protein n=1 Tax=Aphanomyces astaci TaxID=112090 RepID=A0A9X8EA75_APHAT|nr:hypothetical protein DYB28_014544 [Aphanomyces astaci]